MMSTVIQDLTPFLKADGKIDEGKLVRYYRKEVKKWGNAQILADLYNELLGENISARWIQRMEQQDKVPVDRTRRWILATLLSIPPGYLGLTALEALTQPQARSAILTLTPVSPLDLREYTIRLKTLWRSNYANTKEPDLLAEIIARIYKLQGALLYGDRQQREQVAFLLCHYLLVCGNIHRYQGYFTAALPYFNDALTLAKERNYYELYTKALYLRGFTCFNQWTLWQNRNDYRHLTNAVRDLSAAQKYVDASEKQNIPLSQPLMGAVFADGGRAQAYSAQDKQDRLAAMNRIDQGERVVSASHFQEDAYFLRVDEEWCAIDKAEAHLASGWPDSALQELENISQGDASLHQRYLYTYILEGEASIARRWVEVGIAHLENALSVFTDTTSRRHLNHIVRIYEELSQHEKYRHSPDRARLGVRIFQVQHPEIF